jgi:hypothetical protein
MSSFLVISRSQIGDQYEIDGKFSCRGEAERRLVSLMSLRTLQSIGTAFMLDMNDEHAVYLAIIHDPASNHICSIFLRTIPSDWKATDIADRFEYDGYYAVILNLR